MKKKKKKKTKRQKDKDKNKEERRKKERKKERRGAVVTRSRRTFEEKKEAKQGHSRLCSHAFLSSSSFSSFSSFSSSSFSFSSSSSSSSSFSLFSFFSFLFCFVRACVSVVLSVFFLFLLAPCSSAHSEGRGGHWTAQRREHAAAQALDQTCHPNRPGLPETSGCHLAVCPQEERGGVKMRCFIFLAPFVICNNAHLFFFFFFFFFVLLLLFQVSAGPAVTHVESGQAALASGDDSTNLLCRCSGCPRG